MTAITTNTVPRRDVDPAAPKKRKKNDSRAALGFLTPSAVGMTVFILLPTILAIATSFFNWPTFGEISFAGLDNYRNLFAPGSQFTAALINTVVFTLLIVPINLVLTLSTAFWVASSRFSRLYRVLFFLPVVTPTVATAVIWKLIYQPNGIVDSTMNSLFGIHLPNLLGDSSTALIAVVVVIVWQGFGYNMLIFSAAIDQLPQDIIDASKLDGAHGLTQLMRIKIPLLTPAIFFATTVTMISAFQLFSEPFVMTAGGPGTSTVTVVMNVYQTAFQDGELGAAAAPAIILFVLILIVTLIQWIGQKKWVHYD
ncbi:carbohydrate ABC transporter permease [Arthrobacter sp. HY1533]|uniref:carbohydrate ABC transporter permease n=1 Tax=Arthrobacter sp. HY1533 TaxID=2970919 RepID=UPI0022B9E096|nr:sugar ABC transporter permease [Arthrobacter sp. HY1533]